MTLYLLRIKVRIYSVMNIIYQKEIGKRSQLALAKVDDISENTLDTIKEKLSKTQHSFEADQFKSLQRKIHWYGTRLLLAELLQDKEIKLSYDEYGKPTLNNSFDRISISHTANYIAVFVSDNVETGIDIEKMKPKIIRIANRFMHPDELEQVSGNKIEHLYVYWCAKETLFKLYGKGNLDFKKNLSIESFEYKEKGVVKGRILKGDIDKVFDLSYKRIEDIMMVYGVGQP